MKLNHFICPNCGHDFHSDAVYAICDACYAHFYISQSRTCQIGKPYKPPQDTTGGLDCLSNLRVKTIMLGGWGKSSA
jgi:hypothetical protein